MGELLLTDVLIFVGIALTVNVTLFCWGRLDAATGANEGEMK